MVVRATRPHVRCVTRNAPLVLLPQRGPDSANEKHGGAALARYLVWTMCKLHTWSDADGKGDIWEV
jgi:hypothetical protein